MPRIRRGDICRGSGRFAVRFGALLVVVDFVGDADMHCVPFTRFLKEVSLLQENTKGKKGIER